MVGALRAVAGDADLAVDVTAVESHHGAQMHLLAAEVTRNGDVRRILEALLASAPAPAARLSASLPQRIDEDGVFWLRADKQAAAQEEVRMADVEDAVRVLVKMEVHPARHEAVVSAWRAWLDSLGSTGVPHARPS